eukprot:NODE_11845_length_294_cov_21.922449_g10932_i0.p2 GENE.NODE_11845_length_294_cov_21.922449_g10932_i0~~NODE_11845_length_294_cov_21.922449_g10932_i0.p2  ORF type:complete len:63 (+),score=32.78 NODE_11845_length_294_cov_21.922449_g10932_i0:24-191(+)
MGMWYIGNGQKCDANTTNSTLGLLMYLTYYLLFLHLFLEHYVFKKKPVEKKAKSQ